MKKYVIWDITNRDTACYIGANDGNYVTMLEDALKFADELQAWEFLSQFDNKNVDLNGCTVIPVFII